MRKARLIDSRALSPTVRSLTLQTADGGALGHTAGQYVDLVVPTAHGLPFRRPYSIASAPDPTRPDVFDIAVTRVEGGPTSQALHGLRHGALIELGRPEGTFERRPEDRSHPALFVAAGTGLAPIRAMLEEEMRSPGAPTNPRLVLLFGCRSPGDILWEEQLRGWVRTSGRFELDVTLSRPETSWPGRVGYVQRHVGELAASLPDVRVYVCGLSAMVEDVVTLVAGSGQVPPDAVRYETYD